MPYMLEHYYVSRNNLNYDLDFKRRGITNIFEISHRNLNFHLIFTLEGTPYVPESCIKMGF